MIAAAQLPAPQEYFGAGLKPAHYRDALSPKGVNDWAGAFASTFDFFEVHAENYMCDGGPPHAWLSAIAEKFPISLHGVCLSLGGAADPDTEHLKRLRRLVDRYDPLLVSEHIAWSAHDGVHFHDLIAPPLNDTTFKRTAHHIKIAQDALGRQILIENPSHYIAIEHDIAEPDFLNALARDTGCALLLDINNVFVSARNVGFSPECYLDAINADTVGEIHLAGYKLDTASGHKFLIDDHSGPPCDAVGALYQQFIARAGARPTLFEWDTEPPLLDEIARETMKIRQWAATALASPDHAETANRAVNHG